MRKGDPSGSPFLRLRLIESSVVAAALVSARSHLGGVAAAELPLPYRANVYVNELALGVVADAAHTEAECGVAQLQGADAGDADVDGFGEHVLRVLCYAGFGRAGAEEVVRPGRAIAADDVDRCIGFPELGEESVEQVELARVVVGRVFGAVVAEEVVEHANAAFRVLAVCLVRNIDRLARVEMVHLQPHGFHQAGLGGNSDRRWDSGLGCCWHFFGCVGGGESGGQCGCAEYAE
jgi:hypothetical protein